ncbi:uncharacterized protein [Triticum aestivum]|uniref:uncharacterized protein n=1 Tax=Triticum aestivum TaxID=4565 RepID=UPI001D026F21|nr:uncharacterized protein LOC123133108 [Triticum aestivum]
MDAPNVIPQRADPEKKPCADVDEESLQHAQALTDAVDAISEVLDDDNLLREIILRIDFPTTLVRAAVVSRRWYRHVSDREFLSCFRNLHPPRLLGFYLGDRMDHSVPARFFTMQPQPTDLPGMVCRASLCLDTYQSAVSDIIGCQNGKVLISLFDGTHYSVVVHNPLCPERVPVVLPPLPQLHGGYFGVWKYLLTSTEEDGVLSYLYVLVECHMKTTKSTIHIHMLRHGDVSWRVHRTFETYELLDLRWEPNVELADNKIYIATAYDDIVVFDLTASSISRIQLPQGVEYGNRDTRLIRADDASGMYLIHAKKLQLCIWLHKGDSWLLVHNICLREMVAHSTMSNCDAEDKSTTTLQINHVGDYAEFVFLEIGRCAFHLDIKYKRLVKVYDMEEKDQCLGAIHPFMMTWPPTFPTLKDDHARNDI